MILTKEQIENWKKVLSGMFGSYAFLMSDAQIESYAQNLQNYLTEEMEEEGGEGEE